MHLRRLAIPATVALVTVLAAAPALAHAELVSTLPAADARLEVAPEAVVLTFDDELSPSGSGFVVADDDGQVVGGGELDLTVADRNVISGPVTITEPGTYTVEWTSSALDGHEEEGSFVFSVGAPGSAEPPDTATGRQNPTPLGAILLALAVVLALRSARKVVNR